MKFKLHITSFFLMLFVFSAFAQTEEKLKAIQTTIEQIDKSKNLRVKELLNDYYVDSKNIATDNGQELRGYYKNDILVKIVYALGISCCMNTTEYYFSSGELIFVHEKQDVYLVVYDENGEFAGMDFTRLEPKYQGCFYFENQKVIKQETSGEQWFEGKNSKEEKFLGEIQDHLEDLKQSGSY